MLSFTGGLKVFIAMEPCDMRKGFDGLHAAVSERLKEGVRSGALFVAPYAAQGALLRWHGTLVDDEAAGTGHVLLAACCGVWSDKAAARAIGFCAPRRWYRHAQNDDAPVV